MHLMIAAVPMHHIIRKIYKAQSLFSMLNKDILCFSGDLKRNDQVQSFNLSQPKFVLDTSRCIALLLSYI